MDELKKANKTKKNQDSIHLMVINATKCKCKSRHCHWIVSRFCKIWRCSNNKVKPAAKKMPKRYCFKRVIRKKKILFETHLLMSFPPQLHYQNRGREKTSVRSACSRTGGRNDGRCRQRAPSHSQDWNSWAWILGSSLFILKGVMSRFRCYEKGSS